MESSKPHVLCIPFPAYGHISPMLTLAKLLHSKNFHVTFVHTEFNKAQLLRSHGPNALGEQPDFQFKTVPDGIPDPEAERNNSVLFRTMAQRPYIEPLRALLTRINDPAASDVPPVTCIVLDYILYPVLDVAEEFGVQRAVYMSTGVTGLLSYSLFEKLIQTGVIPFKGDDYMTNGEIDKVIDCVPGATDLRLRDLPGFIRTTDLKPFVLQFFINVTNQIKKASAILFNSFDALEQDALRYLSSDFPPLYPIGPMHFLIDSHNGEKTKLITSNLLKEDSDYLSWLDSFAPRSVLYVNFGTTTTMTNDNIMEFAMGLANSQHPFLWITRPSMVIGDNAILPAQFLVETKERCMITSWCNQEEVLAHPSIGAFLTHNGWNSTLESVYNGVPMICWPFIGDQPPYCWLACKKWGVGSEIDSTVKRSDIEEKVKEMMEGNKGIEMTRKALEWKTLAHEATLPPNGSSYTNLDKVINLLVTKA